MNVYKVILPDYPVTGYSLEDLEPIYGDEREQGYFAAETRGRAIADAIKRYGYDEDRENFTSCRAYKVGVTSAQRGEIDFDEFHPDIDQIEAYFAANYPVIEEATDVSK